MEITIIVILLAIVVGIGFVYILGNKKKGKVRYIFSSPQGEKIVTDWKTFDQEEYNTILSVHTHPEEAQYIKTDDKGVEVIVSIPFILNGFVKLERR